MFSCFKMSLRLKIWLSILVLVTLFTLNSVIIYNEIQDNKDKGQEMSEKIVPSVNFLYDLKRNVSERMSLISDWVYHHENQKARERLVDIHSDSRNTFLQISQVADNYTSPAWRDSITSLSYLLMNLSASENQIMATLVSQDDYKDPEKKSYSVSYLDDELFPTATILNEKINLYIRYTETWRSVQTKAIASSSKLVTQLSVLLVLEILILGFVLSFILETILIKPIIEVKNTLDKLRHGVISKKKVRRKDEIGAIESAVNGLADRVDEMSEFALQIGQRNFDLKFEPLSDSDKLGRALLRMRADLRKSISRLEETQKIAGTGYLEYNPTTTRIQCSDIIWEILDVEREIPEPTLTDFLKVCSSEGTLDFQIQIRDCMKSSGKFEMILPIISYKRKHKILSLSGKHIITPENMTGKVVVVVQDITVRKMAEANLKETHDQMEAFFKNMKDVFFSYDINTKQLLQISDACEEVYGYTKEDFQKNFKLIEDVIVDDDKVLFQEKKMELQIGNPVVIEYRIKNRHDEIKWVETKMTPSFNETGKIVRLDGITSDISQRKQSEEALNKTNNDLRKSNSELDKFVYSVSHDLRAPLTSMQGIVELTEMQSKEKLTRKHMNMLQKSIKKLDNFISDILHYSRNSRLDIKSETVDFKEMLADISRELQYMDGHDTELVIDNTVNADTDFYSDNNRLRIVLSNLISNSIRYKDAAKENPFVNVSVTANEEYAQIVVEDNGIGIKKEHQEKVFNMFYRVSEKSAGSGLGLYIVKETIEKMNGEISIDSVPGIGTKVYVNIPNLYMPRN
jgi:PAS domain S-box-containing protein